MTTSSTPRVRASASSRQTAQPEPDHQYEHVVIGEGSHQSIHAERREHREQVRDLLQPSLSPRAHGPRDSRLEAACERRILHIVRVSDRSQVDSSTGGNEEQLRQIDFLRPYGITPGHPRLTIMEVRGKGVTWRASRKHMAQLFEYLDSGKFGLILARDPARLSRNPEDSGKLIGCMQRHKIMLLLGGQPFDVVRSGDLAGLQGLFSAAGLMASTTHSNSVTGRMRDAAAADVLLAPCTGLIAADPTDPLYGEQLKTAGLLEHIAPERLAQHLERFHSAGRILHYLPFPDRKVYDATMYCLREIRRLGSVALLAKAIRAGANGYPEPGKMPIVDDVIFDHRTTVKWSKVSTRQLRRWLASKFLYGTYQHSAGALRELTPHGQELPQDVVILNAFPSYATPDDEATIAPILARDERYRDDDLVIPRTHVLQRLVCHHPLEDGPCGQSAGRLMIGGYLPYVYQSVRCLTMRDHQCIVMPAVEPAVVSMVQSCFSPEQVAAAVTALRVRADSPASDIERLRAKLKELQTQIDSAGILAGLAAARGDGHAVTLHEGVGVNALKERATVEQALRDAQTRGQASRAWAQQDIQRLRRLASDLPALFAQAGAVDADIAARVARGVEAPERARLSTIAGHTRRLIRALTKDVTVRPLSSDPLDANLAVRVRFPNGAFVERIVPAAYFPHAHAAGVYCTQRLALGATPETLAHELTTLLAAAAPGDEATWRDTATPDHADHADGAHRAALGVVWSASRVLAAAHAVATPTVVEHIALEIGNCPPETSLAAVQARTQMPASAVLRAALSGALGYAAWSDGELHVQATDAQCARAFPSFARASIAARMGWPEDDVVRMSALAQPGQDARAVRSGARAGGGAVQDAAGHWHTRRSLFLADREQQVARAVSETWPTLAPVDLRQWPRMQDFRRESPLSRKAILDRLPTVSLGVEDGWAAAVYVYAGPNALEYGAQRSLEQRLAVLRAEQPTAVPPDATVHDFIDMRELAHAWERIGGPSLSTLDRAVTEGRIVMIYGFLPTGQGKQSRHVFVPPTMRRSQSAGALYAWLGIAPPGQYQRHGRSRLARATRYRRMGAAHADAAGATPHVSGSGGSTP